MIELEGERIQRPKKQKRESINLMSWVHRENRSYRFLRCGRRNTGAREGDVTMEDEGGDICKDKEVMQTWDPIDHMKTGRRE